MDFNKTTYAVITGASKGLGKIISLHLAKRLKCPSKFVLIARNDKGLEETKKEILKENGDHTVEVCTVDLSRANLEDYKRIIETTADKRCENSVIFHNAGSIGRPAKTTELTNLEEWTTFFNLTLFSTTLLNSAFLEKLKDNSKCHVVNISSYASRKPVLGMGLYCSGKAARDLYFGCVSVEEPKVRVMNYSPGPVKTDIFQPLTEASDELQNAFANVKYLDGDLTIEWLLNVLEQGNYNTGEFVDYLNRK